MIFHLNWFLDGISSTVIAVICFHIFYTWYRRKYPSKAGEIIGLNGVLFLIYSILTFAWSFEILKPIESDFILIGGFFNIINAALFTIIIYNFVRDKNLLYILFLFILTALAIPPNISTFFLTISLISYAIIAIVSFDLFLLKKKSMKRAGIYSLIYSVTSILFLIFIFKGFSLFEVMWFIPNTIYAIVFLFFLFDIEHLGTEQQEISTKVRKEIGLLLFFKFMIFIISISIFMLLSTVVVHELGHSLAAQYYGCEKTKAVIYDVSDSPRTEMICEGYYNDKIITLAGIILPMIVGLIFILAGSSFTTNLSYLIFGFSLIISSKDLVSLNASTSWSFLINTIGILILLYGIIKLSENYVKQRGGLSEEEPPMEIEEENIVKKIDTKNEI